MNEWDMALDALHIHGRYMICGMIAGLILALGVLFFQKPVWEARMTIAPSQRTGMPNISSLLPQGTAGTPVLQYFVERIDAANTSDFTMFETIINGPRLAHHLIERGMHDLFPDIRTVGEMTLWLKKNVRIHTIGTTPFRQISLRSTDPKLAVKQLDTLYYETDRQIRQDTMLQTNRRITYLKEQLKQTIHPDHKDAVIALLKEQEQTAMMVSIDNHFAAIPVQQTSLSPEPVAPNALILLPVCIFGGLVGGLVFGGLRQAWHRSRT